MMQALDQGCLKMGNQSDQIGTGEVQSVLAVEVPKQAVNKCPCGERNIWLQLWPSFQYLETAAHWDNCLCS